MPGLFLTGATGFVGAELIVRYLERSDRHVFALVRADDDAAAEERLRGVATALFGEPDAYADRLHAVRGELSEEGLGLEPARRRALAESVDEVIHSAASVSFTQPLEKARKTNVEGTREVLRLAEAIQAAPGGLRSFAYVSTAYVAGDRGGTAFEHELDVGQGFRNSYEQSKLEAERLAHTFAGRLPLRIFRPSIIVGDGRTGWTQSFNVLYGPLRTFSVGAMPVVPARRRSPVDVVPVDYVADGIFTISQTPPGAEPETYHLTAGARATSVDALVKLSTSYFDRPAPRLIPPSLYRRFLRPVVMRRSDGAGRMALENTESLFPYFSMRIRYDDSRARERLEPAGVRMPPLEEYYGRVLDYAVRARWGKRQMTRVQAAEAAV